MGKPLVLLCCNVLLIASCGSENSNVDDRESSIESGHQSAQTLVDSYAAKTEANYLSNTNDFSLDFDSFQKLTYWALEKPIPRVGIVPSIYQLLENPSSFNTALDEILPCDEFGGSGHVKVTGLLNSEGLGSFDIEYIECLNRGFLYNGTGHLEILEQLSNTIIHYRNYYDEVIAVDSSTAEPTGNSDREFNHFTLQGYVEQYGGATPRASQLVTEHELSYYMLYSNQDSALQVFDQSRYFTPEKFSTTQTTGQIIYSDFGKASIDGLDYYFEGPDYFTLTGNDGSAASLFKTDNLTYRFQLDQDGDGEFERTQDFESLDDFYSAETE